MRACFDELEQIADELPETGLHRGSYFVIAEKNGRRVINRVVWAGGCQRYLLDVGSDPRLTVPSAQLLQSGAMDHLRLNLRLHVQAAARRRHLFDWHQDDSSIATSSASGTWADVNGCGEASCKLHDCRLDEMTPDSGPLKFMPGSGKWLGVSNASVKTPRPARSGPHGDSRRMFRERGSAVDDCGDIPVTRCSSVRSTAHASFDEHFNGAVIAAS